MNHEDFLEAYIKDRQKIVEEALERYLPDEDSVPEELHTAAHYSVFAGGKRIRPILCLAAAEACGADMAPAMPAACALELITPIRSFMTTCRPWTTTMSAGARPQPQGFRRSAGDSRGRRAPDRSLRPVVARREGPPAGGTASGRDPGNRLRRGHCRHGGRAGAGYRAPKKFAGCRGLRKSTGAKPAL